MSLPEDLYVIGNNAFQNTAVERIFLPEYTGRIGVEAFRDCKKLRLIDFNDNIEMVNEESFRGCTALHELQLPNLNSVYYGSNAFAESGVSVIHIPFNVDTDCFNEGTFANCKNLVRVQVDIPNPVDINDNVFEGSYSKASLVVPNGMISTYQTLGGWKNFFRIYDHNSEPTGIEQPSSITHHPSPIYDLQGRRVENAQKGIYIQNGRLVVIK